MAQSGELSKNEVFEHSVIPEFPLNERLLINKNSSSDGTSVKTYNLMFIINMSMMAAIGGFLFGYDTGVIGGAELYFHDDFPDITSGQKEMIVSLTVFGACFGCLLIGPFSDNYGRKPTIIISDVLFNIGAILMYISEGIPMLMAGRFIAGLGVGAASMVVPIYLAELSPTSIRGRIVTCNLIFVTTGQFIAYWIVVACNGNWRLMLGLSGIPATIQLICMLFFPESPKWLLKMDRTEDAEKVFTRVFNVEIPEGKDDMDREIALIKEEMELEDVKTSQWVKYKELFTVYRKIVFIGIMLQVWQQLSGINTIMYYGPEVMKQAGFGSSNDELSSIYATIPLSGVNVIGTFVALLFIDRMGRRYILLRTLPGCGVSMCAVGLGMILLNNNITIGQWIAVVGIFFYMGFFAVGVGPTPWAINSEIYPLHLRGIGNSMATLGNWTGNYVISELFLTATDTELGEDITYFVLGIICIAAFIFVYYLVPETKDRSIEENIKNFLPELRNTVLSIELSRQNKDDS